MTEELNKEGHDVQTQQHVGPHIPKLQWETVYGPINNTNIASFIFLIIVVIFSLYAKKALKKEDSKLKVCLLDFLSILDKNMSDSFHDKAFARSYFPLIAWFFVVVLFGNLFGLLIDWVGASISPSVLVYLRPMNSDLNTTLVLWLITVVTFLWISIKHAWAGQTLKWYLFNFSGKSIAEKIINVFVGWLHLFSVPSTVASLSLRLFGNIFAGVILIGVISYLWALISAWFFEVGRVISIPFWFFEVFVAFIQAAVFYMLMISYFNQSKAAHH